MAGKRKINILKLYEVILLPLLIASCAKISKVIKVERILSEIEKKTMFPGRRILAEGLGAEAEWLVGTVSA